MVLCSLTGVGYKISQAVNELAPIKTPLINQSLRNSRHIDLLNLLLQHFPPRDHLFGHILPRQFMLTHKSLRLLLDIHIDQLTRSFPQHTINHDVFDVTRMGVQNNRGHGIVLRGGNHPRRCARENDQVCLLAFCDAPDLVSHLGSTGATDGGEVEGLFDRVVYRQGGFVLGEELLFL